MRSPRTNISSGEKVRLPPINSLSSQQLQMHQPIASRGPPPQDEPDGGSTKANQNETSRVHSISNQEMNRGSPTDPDLSSSVDRLPKLPRQTSLVSMSPCEEQTSTEQAHLKRPFISLPSQAQLKLTRRSTFKNILLTSTPVVSLPDPDKEEDGQEILNLSQLPEPSRELTTESKRDSPSPQVSIVKGWHQVAMYVHPISRQSSLWSCILATLSLTVECCGGCGWHGCCGCCGWHG